MSRTIESTPKADGFRMPGEFEPHAASWLLWPQRTDNWRQGARPAQKAFTDVAAAISRFEPVTVGVNQSQYSNARSMLPETIRVVELSNNDSWIRDCGPTFIKNDKGEVRGIDWDFNAWGGLIGGLYFPWDLDDMVARKVLEMERVDRYKAPIVLEGGSIHVDGEGTLLTTEECLLNENRNPNLSREEIEAVLKDYLNISKIIWLDKGIYNDETNGHVDNIACFIRPGEVLLSWTDDVNDPQYAISKDAYNRLSHTVDARGRKLIVHKIHIPNPILISKEESEGVDAIEGTLPRNEGDRMAASYVNFFFCNGGAVVPTFNDPHDSPALEVLKKLLPGRKIIGIPAKEILLGGGNIHCITQQQIQA